ncbi:MAG: PD40 domain-containing protein [Kiritimatiellae bacterium]|nr:PD40 domain-containing protein [Kiritimatiellia bacterium]
MKAIAFGFCLALATAAGAADNVVRIRGTGAAKTAVEIHVSNRAFAQCLQKNLELSGRFIVAPKGTVRVVGAPGAIHADGGGKAVSCTKAFADDKSARMAARELSDAMCEAYAQQKGFAMDKIVFLNRGQAKSKGEAMPGEICVGYPDGWDVRQLTSDGKMTVFPRWRADGKTILYISDKNGAPQIWEMDTESNRRNTKWSFKGSPTGIAVSPDGTRVAAILSFQGNPELYVLQGDRFTRLTNTSNASEGQPTWSPDGKKIAYVSNETRHPQIYVIDVATKAKRRLTSKGRENIDPDWGPDGRIAYITKRGGAQVAVMSPADGDASSQLVTEPANWEHPSWSRDRRHVVANRDRALFLIDTVDVKEGGDAPRQLFRAAGNWISPCWIR